MAFSLAFECTYIPAARRQQGDKAGLHMPEAEGKLSISNSPELAQRIHNPGADSKGINRGCHRVQKHTQLSQNLPSLHSFSDTQPSLQPLAVHPSQPHPTLSLTSYQLLPHIHSTPCRTRATASETPLKGKTPIPPSPTPLTLALNSTSSPFCFPLDSARLTPFTAQANLSAATSTRASTQQEKASAAQTTTTTPKTPLRTARATTTTSQAPNRA